MGEVACRVQMHVRASNSEVDVKHQFAKQLPRVNLALAGQGNGSEPAHLDSCAEGARGAS